MSPIGRVIIVLNLIAAGVFAGFAGTNLQRQHHWKDKFTKKEAELAEKVKGFDSERARLESERNTFENAKTAKETELGAANNSLLQANDEIKRQQQLLNSMEAQLKHLASTAEANGAEMKQMATHAKQAFDMAIADQKTRDEAVNAKNVAEAENKTLKTTIASLEDTVKQRELSIADLTKEKNRLGLLVSVAQQKGFMPSMAAPSLAGMVTNASANLCTIQVTDNPGKIDIADAIAQNPFAFAIYDGGTYKGEAVATKYEPSANAVLCSVRLVKGEIKEGDKAATRTP